MPASRKCKLILFSLIIALASRSSAQGPTKYFGFFASAMEGVGTGNYISEISSFANLSWIQGGNVEAKLQQSRAANEKAMVVIYEAFYPTAGNWKLPSPGSTDAQAMQARWHQWAQRLRPYQDTIAAFYVMDEPYSKKISRDDLERITKIVKADFPKIPTAVIFEVKDLKHGNFMPPSLDWAAFDCYSMKCDNAGNYKLLKRGLTPTQKTFLVPTAFKNAPVQDIIAQANLQLQICQKDSACVGLVPFLWQTFSDSHSTHAGARDVPELAAAYRQIGRALTGKSR